MTIKKACQSKLKIMNISTNGEYNPVQINETVNLSPEGRIISKSLMINLRGETPKKVHKTYQELKNFIEGKKENPVKKAKDNPGKKEKQNKKEQKKDNPGLCPECNGLLIEKQGISKKNGKPYHFWGCGNFPICGFTKPFLIEKEMRVHTKEDMISVGDIPF